MFRRQRAQPVGGHQHPAALVEHPALHVAIERRGRQADCEQLIGSGRRVGAIWAVDHIEETQAIRPDEALETHPRALGRFAIGCRHLAELLGKTGHRHQRVVPQRIDLDRLADARHHHPIADPCIHPGQLHTGFAGA